MEPECNICFGRYDAELRAPLVLECGHSLCAQCLAGLLAQPALRCPFGNCALKPRALGDFPRNYALLETLARGKWNCRAHGRPAEVYCAECREGACERCLEAHDLAHAMLPAAEHVAATRDFLAEALRSCLALQQQVGAQRAEAETEAERLAEERNIISLLAANICSNFRAAIALFEADLRREIERVVAPLANRLIARRGCQAELRQRFLEQNGRKAQQIALLSAKAQSLAAFEGPELAAAVEELRRGQRLNRFELSGSKGGSARPAGLEEALAALQADLLHALGRSFAADSRDLLLRVQRFETDVSCWAESRLLLYA